MIKIESSIKSSIILTGYAGYKYLMKMAKLTSLEGYVKMPGCNLNITQKKILSKAFEKFTKKRINFIKNNNL